MADWSPIYKTGTATLTNGQTAVTGQGTSWNTAGLRAGDQIKAAGYSVTIAAINPNGIGLTLAEGWPGVTRTALPYEILRISDADRLIAAHADLMAALVPNLTSLGGLSLAANKGIHATGAGALATHDLTAFGRALAGLTGANGKIPVATAAGSAAMRDIVGTVSQAGGVPTGAIIQRGSNANGDFLRFADGTQICMMSAVLPAQAISTAASSTVTFPAQFAAADYFAYCSARFAGEGTNMSNIGLTQYNGVYFNNLTPTTMVLQSYSYRSATTISTRFNVLAIGRWF